MEKFEIFTSVYYAFSSIYMALDLALRFYKLHHDRKAAQDRDSLNG